MPKERLKAFFRASTAQLCRRVQVLRWGTTREVWMPHFGRGGGRGGARPINACACWARVRIVKPSASCPG